LTPHCTRQPPTSVPSISVPYPGWIRLQYLSPGVCHKIANLNCGRQITAAALPTNPTRTSAALTASKLTDTRHHHGGDRWQLRGGRLSQGTALIPHTTASQSSRQHHLNSLPTSSPCYVSARMDDQGSCLAAASRSRLESGSLRLYVTDVHNPPMYLWPLPAHHTYTEQRRTTR